MTDESTKTARFSDPLMVLRMSCAMRKDRERERNFGGTSVALSDADARDHAALLTSID